jgi:hypothetical protein
MQRLDLLPEDLEDLVHTFEASFGISLTERELCKAKSIGGLADYVSRKINSPRTSRCLSSVVFYRLRQTFITSFKIPPAAIKRKTPLHILMPWVTRRKGWREVQHALQVELTQLLYPVWVIVSSIIITGLVFWAEWLRLVAFSGKALGLAIFFGVFFLWIVVLRVLEPLARKFPRSCETFGDLAKLTLGRNYGKISSERDGWSSEREILLVLRQLIAAETGVVVDDIEPGTLVFEDIDNPVLSGHEVG